MINELLKFVNLLRIFKSSSIICHCTKTGGYLLQITLEYVMKSKFRCRFHNKIWSYLHRITPVFVWSLKRRYTKGLPYLDHFQTFHITTPRSNLNVSHNNNIYFSKYGNFESNITFALLGKTKTLWLILSHKIWQTKAWILINP